MSDITFDASEVLGNLAKFNNRLAAALALDAKNVAAQMEEWAKNTAIWTDQSSHARQYMKAHVEWEHVDELVVSMSHHVEYGIFLELAMDRKYAILEAAIAQYEQDFLNGWKEIAEGSRL